MSACSGTVDTDRTQEQFQTLSVDRVSVDTIIRGQTFIPRAHRVSWDSLTPPRIIPTGKPRVLAAPNNVFTAGETLSIPLPESELACFTPGEKGILPPQKIEIHSQNVPAIRPIPIPAGDPRFKDVAIHDIRYLPSFISLISFIVVLPLKRQNHDFI